jgi:hypothetical protein
MKSIPSNSWDAGRCGARVKKEALLHSNLSCIALRRLKKARELACGKHYSNSKEEEKVAISKELATVG